ncbi:tRNA 2-selenouridine synthase [Desulfonispora thiosulfatigenes DSM 11270]|uniref:tRNA 2-selenouridine synthase n=1 Tax=Desulfonispora thiosulfatigenes DSM 11270 TaxID=656914 RepID=A0A1W1UCN7_DESTI|nr:tRNA 2-selenouridine(34) synthase MnmH [Desulfonispora thiosulfatigenes]SMB78827.1 tRNA 2-selenouridine synthase [Desulfonispora thiosulfatigenes DSM 11270]
MNRSSLSNYTYNDFEKIVLEKIPLIDVRAPIEYEKGAFLNAINLPLMNDEERHLVGICYKEKGNKEAVKLGHQLVSGDLRKSRIDAWSSYITKHPNTMIYCFRGGQRSAITQKWIKEATGNDVLRLQGGYKAFRNYLIEELSPEKQISTPILLGGYTGSGKTILLKELKNAIDLEGIAHHRGSSFGNHVTPQPSQIDFENNLSYALISHKHEKHKYMILEDESRNIGYCFIPKELFEFFRKGNLVVLNVPFEERVQITFNEYVLMSQANYIDTFGHSTGLIEWSGYITRSINKLQKRLGVEGHKRLLNVFEDAFKIQIGSNKPDLHRNWIEILLKEYYDPMYSYQMKKCTREMVFQGNAKEVIDYFKMLA